MSMRLDADKADPNRLPDIFRELGLGALLAKLIAALTVTESAITVTTNVATLANQPAPTIWQINATAGTTTGVKALKIGAITGPGAIVPKTGEAVWDGAKKVLFATVDAVTAASFTYPTAADAVPTILQRDSGQAP